MLDKIKNKKSKFLLFPALAVTSVVGFVIVACAPAEQVKVTNINTSSEKFILPEDLTVDKLPKIAVITDKGQITDRSFNQSVYEAANEIKAQIEGLKPEFKGKVTVQSLKPGEAGEYEDFRRQYDVALRGGFKYWFLPGFAHADYIGRFWADNKQKMEELGVIIFTIDSAPETSTNAATPATPKGSTVSFNFKVHEAAFIAGYAAAKYVSETYEKKEDRILATFGGADAPGVTNFNRGYLSGIAAWNDTVDSDKRVKMNTENIPLNSGFSPNQITPVAKNSIIGGVKMILPVAGPGTKTTADMIRQEKQDTLVIGVDVDQSKETKQNTGLFFTSIEKNMGQALYDVFRDIFNGKIKPGTENTTFNKGLADKWAVLSEPTLSDATKQARAKAAIKAAEDFYNDAKNKTKIDELLKNNEDLGFQLQTYLNNLAKQINSKFNSTAPAESTTAKA
ncbi:BMP family ABC transporter substrate-binding protein [Mycoplasma iguanae]|uniref:BMP family ABC transporter substrate-binding protein n=1 Tax=Mycoplasma iguanae TaxID=292461 RepID=A0ABY5R8A1_9MOLU|nr:BMP family ABC transporter substrate-binding protein [Mycoplasma iguanae]UVD81708.1 BMP family ABC transporter substrate-binding protein [Mycoplasma iguanae]